MDLQTSSAINKSGKVIAPKAAGRRRPAARAPTAQHAPPTPEASQAASVASTAEEEATVPPIDKPDNSGSQPVNAPPTPRDAEETIETRTTATAAVSDSAPQAHVSTGIEQDSEAVAGAEALASFIQQARTERVASPESEAQHTQSGCTDVQGPGRGQATRQQKEAPKPVAGTKRKRTTAKPQLSTELVSDSDDKGDAGVRAASEMVVQPSATPTRAQRGRQAAAGQNGNSDTTAADMTGETGTTSVPKPTARPRKRKAASQSQPGAETVTSTPSVEVNGDATGNVGTNDGSNGQISNTTEGPNGVQAPTSSSATAKPKPKARRVRRTKTTQSTAGAGLTVDQVADGNQEADRSNETAEAAGPSEEDLEAMEIDVTKTAMLDLVRLPAGGKTSTIEKRMAEVDWDEVRRKRRLGISTGPDTANAAALAVATTPADPNSGPRLRIVNNEIQYDEESSAIDRQAQALLNAQNMALVQDQDVTRQINNMSWINDKRRDPAERNKPRATGGPWTDDETDRFYDALRMFGTDFAIISKMFPPKTRRQIKLKFVREERMDAARVDQALGGKGWVQMDLKHFATASGVEESEFRDPEEVNRELAAAQEAQDAEVDAKKKEAAEAQKQRDIMEAQREKDKEGRDREKAVQKQQRDLARQRKRAGRGMAIGTGTF